MGRRRTIARIGLVAVTLLAMACQEAGLRAPAVADAPESPELGEALFDAVDAAIEAEMQDNYLPGVGVVLVQNGRTIYSRGYGVENVETGVPVEVDRTVFRIGSISKALTLLTLARLVDDGRLDRSDDVSEFVSGIENEPGFTAPVTIEHLLTHTTGFDQPGLGRQIEDFDRPLEDRLGARRDLSAFLADRNLRRVSAAGGYFRYDTYGPTLAGVILERLTGLSYADAMTREMFAPLGMTRTSVEVEPDWLPDLASGHGYVEGAFVRTPYEIYLTTPASSIDATVADMGRLLEALTGDGSNRHGRLFSGAMARAIKSPQYRPHPDFAGMSHGLWESFGIGRGAEAIPVYTLGHGGDMWGFNSQMLLIPEFGLGFFVVTNRNGEAGGPGVSIGAPVLRAILATLAPGRVAVAAPVPQQAPNADLSEYAGDYHWGVYCHSCTPEDFARGAWPQPRATRVSTTDGGLRIGRDAFVQLDGDVFVRTDGFDHVFFRRNAQGGITSFSYREDPTVYERAN